jgi:hypothetical protein
VAARRPGPVLRATRASVKAAVHLVDPRFSGAIAAAEALARLIDEAPAEENARIVVRAVPHYLAALNELLLTPRSLPAIRSTAPAEAEKAAGGGTPAKETPVRGSKVAQFAEAAARLRGGTVG